MIDFLANPIADAKMNEVVAVEAIMEGEVTAEMAEEVGIEVPRADGAMAVRIVLEVLVAGVGVTAQDIAVNLKVGGTVAEIAMLAVTVMKDIVDIRTTKTAAEAEAEEAEMVVTAGNMIATAGTEVEMLVTRTGGRRDWPSTCVVSLKSRLPSLIDRFPYKILSTPL